MHDGFGITLGHLGLRHCLDRDRDGGFVFNDVVFASTSFANWLASDSSPLVESDAAQELVTDSNEGIHVVRAKISKNPNQPVKAKKQPKEAVKSTEEILLSYLCKWHGIGTNEFRLGPVGLRDFHCWLKAPEQGIGETPHSKATIGRFFKKTFGGFREYCRYCANKGIESQLKLKTGDVTPEYLFELIRDVSEEPE